MNRWFLIALLFLACVGVNLCRSSRKSSATSSSNSRSSSKSRSSSESGSSSESRSSSGSQSSGNSRPLNKNLYPKHDKKPKCSKRISRLQKTIKDLEASCPIRVCELEKEVERLKLELDGKKRPSFRITLNVLSGRPDPVWIMAAEDRNYTELSDLLKKHRQIPQENFILGYRGFTVECLDRSLQDRECEQCPFKVIGRNSDKRLELLLTDTAEGLPDPLRRFVRDIITNPPSRPPPPSTPSFPDDVRPAPFNPKYEPEKWNSGASKNWNNCYNYANNLKTNTYAQPGRGSGQIYISLAGEDVKVAAVNDGLIFVDDACCPNTPPLIIANLVALVIWPGVDFHWYRLDLGNKWSHKMGSGIPTNLDQVSAQISDPRTAARGPYTEFICFMSTKPGTITIE